MINQTWILIHPYGDKNSITIKIVNFISVICNYQHLLNIDLTFISINLKLFC
jgi:hypothetical protein